jgi:hypothetical protein
MNIALLSKWIHKLDSGMDNIATRILQKKYLKGKRHSTNWTIGENVHFTRFFCAFRGKHRWVL